MLPSFFKKLGPISINQIQSKIDCSVVNLTGEETYDNFVSVNNINSNSLTFLYDNESIKNKLLNKVSLVCTKNKIKELSSNQKIIIVENVQKSVAILSNIFYRDLNDNEKINLKKPSIGNNCEIGNNVVIENGVIIGNNVKINHGTVIKYNCIIGDRTEIASNTTISNSIFGEDIYIGSNSSIGQRGFGFHINKNNNLNIYHTGRVLLQSKVSIGSGCTIDRGSFSDTIIGNNTYLDNLCHVAHNVKIGKNCAFAAMTGIAGSARVGNNVLTGGQAGIAGHIKIGNNVRIAAKSGVFSSIDDGEQVMGNPAINQYKFIKNYKKIYGKK